MLLRKGPSFPWVKEPEHLFESFRARAQRALSQILRILYCLKPYPLTHIPSPLLPSSPWGQSAPWPFSLFFCLYLCLLSVSGLHPYFSSSVPPIPPAPLSPLPPTYYLLLPLPLHSPYHTLASLGPETCVTPGCPMAPLTLCIPGITVWGHLLWSLGGGALVGPWNQLSDSHHSPHSQLFFPKPALSSCPSSPLSPHIPLFLFRWAPPTHQIPTTLQPK